MTQFGELRESAGRTIVTIWYGGDYNPEQWQREVWDEDVQLMQRFTRAGKPIEPLETPEEQVRALD